LVSTPSRANSFDKSLLVTRCGGNADPVPVILEANVMESLFSFLKLCLRVL